MKFSALAQLALSTLLVAATGTAAATEPCTPFEDKRVDAELLAEMRVAAKEGRMYRVATGNSRVGFCVRHFPFQEFRGEFINLVGGLALPPAPDEHGRALLLIHTTSMEFSNPDLEYIVRGHQFMDVERYPEILFEGKAFHWYSPTRAHIHGDLTLRGVKQPVVFDVEVDTLESDGHDRPERIYLHGTGQVDRLQFDMRSHQFLVSQTVRLCLSVELERWE
jgi:polyisoprenoid-binding protein YceI